MKCTDENRAESDGVFHERIVRDQFATIPGVTRRVPGDCFCLDCHKPIPAWYNAGRPKYIEELNTGE